PSCYSYLPSHTSHLIHLLFSPLIPRPLRSTLFPYTTLFRSSTNFLALASQLPSGVFIRNSLRTMRQAPKSVSTKLTNSSVSRQLDRKSTRLNSSHVAISYAVFCLKKKKINKTKQKNKKTELQ